MPMVVESTLDLEFTRTAAVKVKIKSIFVISLLHWPQPVS